VLLVCDAGSPDELLERMPLDPGFVEVLAGPGRGPAAARNVGWRASRAEWVAFLDDDVEPEPDWLRRLIDDLREPGIAASQGRIRVPVPGDRRPTDWERNVAGLEDARWATADMAFRRSALAAVGGFDERFPRAYREDADLALRLAAAGFRLTRGRRSVAHPARPAGALVSLRLQVGNADDALMDRLHGRGWRAAAGAPRGRRTRHLAVAGAGAAASLAASLGARRFAAVAGAAWLAGTAELAAARIAPGPRTPREVATMLATSAAMPFAAAGWWLAGVVRARRLAATEARAPRPDVPAAVLFDRDGTLVEDVPYNGDPERVRPAAGAREALERLRAAGVPTAVVSNQSGVARGLLSSAQVEAVNRRIEEVLGPLGPWLVCPHGPDDGCECRKPEPGLVLRAAEALGVPPERCAVVGDIGADVEAARAAGARAVLVPNERTLPEEVAAAPEVAPDLRTAVARLLGEAA
jgi:histidinol-phosphate phosphatase family protein